MTLNSELDRESAPSFRLTVAAVDGGTVPNSATVAVTIAVSDVNDNSPSFPGVAGDALVVTVPEDASTGTVVARLEAADADQGDNGVVVYTLSLIHI